MHRSASKSSITMSTAAGSKCPNVLSHLIGRQYGVDMDSRSHLHRSMLGIARNLYTRDLSGHFGCVNAIEFSGDGELMLSGGDDRRVLLWRMSDVMSDGSVGEQQAMVKQHHSNIFCLAMNKDQTKVLSGGNDDSVLVHDVHTLQNVGAYLQAKPVYGLSIDPNNEHCFATAGEDGRVLIFDLRGGDGEVLALAKNRAPFHAVQFHPLDEHFLITANGKEGAALWDTRQTKAPTLRYGGDHAAQSCMSVSFNALGTQVLALRRRLPPILYKTGSSVPVAQFYHSDYYNSCTMKSCSFAGENDEFIMSGSDDFNLYMWRVHDADMDASNQWIETHQMVLYGHRSIVNQVRYNPQRCVIASSGVEKVIKLWNPFAVPGWSGGLAEEAYCSQNSRNVFTHDDYMTIINQSGLNVTHDYSNQNTSEDPRMMAFFDSLVQREIEGWISNDGSDESDKSSEHSSDGSSRPTSTEESSDNSDDVGYGESLVTNYDMRFAGPWRRAPFMMKPRTIYANRIAYLIATKRNTLKRLALKGAAHTNRRDRTTSKYRGRNMGARITRKGTGKRSSRSQANKRNAVSHEDHDDSSHTQAPKKFTKRRMQQKNVKFRVFRRKSKPNIPTRHNDSPDTSDDDSDIDPDNPQQYTTTSSINNHNLPSTSAASYSSSSRLRNKLRSALRKQDSSARVVRSVHWDESPSDDNDDTETTESRQMASSSNVAVPSTSTGITTTSSPMIRSQLQQQIEDSSDEEEDDAEPNNQAEALNLIPVIPMPLNGTHNFDASCSSGIDEDLFSDHQSTAHQVESDERSRAEVATPEPQPQSDEDPPLENYYNNQARRKRNASGTTSHRFNPNYSSHSNSRLSSSSPDVDSNSRNANTSTIILHKKRRLRDSSPSTSAAHHLSHHVQTPYNSRIVAFRSGYRTRTHEITPDSGIITPHNNDSNSSEDAGPSQSLSLAGPSSVDGDSEYQCHTTFSHSMFQQRIARVRRNYRNNFGEHSDSD